MIPGLISVVVSLSVVDFLLGNFAAMTDFKGGPVCRQEAAVGGGPVGGQPNFCLWNGCGLWVHLLLEL